jgi:hypothetical protein
MNAQQDALAVSEDRRAEGRPTGAVLLLGAKSGMILGSNNEDSDFHR